MAGPLAPIISTPVPNAYLDSASNLSLAWSFRHPDAGKTQAKYGLRRRTPTGAYEYWSGAAWNATTTNRIVSTVQTASIALGGLFTVSTAGAQTPYWISMLVQDTAAAESSWSDEVMVKFCAVPTLVVTNSNVNTSYPRIGWQFTSTMNLPQIRYRVGVYSAAQQAVAGFTVFTSPSTYETGWVSSDNAYYSDMTNVVTSGTVYTSYVQVETLSGLRSAVTNSATMTPTFTLPSAPTGTVTVDNVNGGVIIQLNGAFNLMDTASSEFNSALSVGHWTVLTSCTAVWTADFGWNFNMKLTSTAIATIRAMTTAGTGGYAVTAGLAYSFGMYMVRSTGGTGNFNTEIWWYNSAGTFISTSTGTATASAVGVSQFQKIENIVAPVGAAFAAVAVTAVAAAVGEVFYVDTAVFVQQATASFSPGGFGANAKFIVERYHEYLKTWVPVHGYSKAAPGISHRLSYVYMSELDRLAPLGTSATIQYRAWITSTDSSGLTSIVSTMALFTVTAGLPATSWWLRDPLDPTRDMKIAQVELNATYNIEVEQFNPIGRTRPVLLNADTPVSDSFNIVAWVKTEAELKKLWTLVKSLRTLVVQSTNALSWHVRVSGQSTYQQVMAKGDGTFAANKHLYKVTIPVVEVETPVISYTISTTTGLQVYALV